MKEIYKNTVLRDVRVVGYPKDKDHAKKILDTIRHYNIFEEESLEEVMEIKLATAR